MSKRTGRSRGRSGDEVIDPTGLNKLLRRMRVNCKPETILETLGAIGELGEAAGESERIVHALVRVLAKPDEAVREKAIALLRRLKCHGHAVAPLLELVADEDPELARTASSALGVFGARALAHVEVSERLREWAERADDRSRALAAAFFQSVPARSRNARLCLTMVELLWKGGEEERLMALEILGANSAALIAHEQGLDIIHQGLASESERVRDAALEVLTDGVPGPLTELLQSLCGELEQGLKGGDPWVRHQCANVLHRLSNGALEVPDVSILIADALLNWDPEVRRLAAASVPADLERMSREADVLERLELVVHHGTDDVRTLAEETLRRLSE